MFSSPWPTRMFKSFTVILIINFGAEFFENITPNLHKTPIPTGISLYFET